MKALPLILLAGGAYIVSKAISGKNVADALKFNVDVFSFKVSGSSPVMILAVKIINPSPSSTQVKSFAGTITWQDREVADLVFLQALTIKPKSVTTIKIPVQFHVYEAVTALFAMITNKAQRLCKLKMIFYTSLGKVPFDKDLVIGPPAK